MAKARRIVQVLFVIFFVILFIRARYPYETGLPSDIFLRFSPLIPLFDFIDQFRISLLFWPALLILLLTPFLGRFFCGWICPLGTTLDATSRVFKSKKDLRKQKDWKVFRPVKFGILVALIVLAIFSIPIWGIFDPLSIFNRALTAVLYPFGTLVFDKGLLQVSRVPFLEDTAYSVYDWFKVVIMPEEQAQVQQVFWITAFFGGILALEAVSRRFWCRNLCPAGAFLGFLSQFRFYERLVGSACPSCGKCQRECKMDAIPQDNVRETNKVECIECFNCGETCPPEVDAIEYKWRWKPYHSPVDFNRRGFLNTTLGSFAGVGLFAIGLKNRNAKAEIIRPPGSLPENEFLDRCIRCLECVRICESNGRCLQPDGIQTSLLELWAPTAIMREGYCEYNCNLCGEVCPTEAILPLSLEQKHQVKMGLAYFDKNLCIPWAQNEDCLVCEEHCPVPDKAIKFREEEFEAPDGTVRIVKYPYVDKNECIGCGICEFKCPLPGNPGVFVTNENEMRLTEPNIPVQSDESSSSNPYG